MQDEEVFSLSNSTSSFDAFVLGIEAPAPSWPSDPLGSNAATVKDDFIASFRRHDQTLPTAIKTLEGLLQDFPELCNVDCAADGPKVHFHRAQIIHELQKRNSSVIFTSFERGLKHAGLEVVVSTHGEQKVKIWKRKRDEDEPQVRSRPPKQKGGQ